MPETAVQLPAPTPDRYEKVADLSASLDRKGTADPGEGLYPRDGTEEVTRVEEAISELTIPGQELNVVVSSGMAAVGGAVRFSLQSGVEDHGGAPTLAYPPYLYPQSTRTFEALRNIGVDATGFDPGDNGSIDRLFPGTDDWRQAEVIFAETVSNTPAMPVLDVHHLLAKARNLGENAPILVLDNTLPLSTGVPFEGLLTKDDRVLIVESATKSAMHNSEHLGVVYSKNEELMDGFRKYKATEGLVTSTRADTSILETLRISRDEFHRRNQAAYESTRLIAVALREAQEELGVATDFTVSHPNLPDHPNYEYVSREMENGVSPVVFMDCTQLEDCSSLSLLTRIAEHARIREQIEEGQIFLGQSFGFKEGTLLYDPNATQVRIAGGYDIDTPALADALREAAADL